MSANDVRSYNIAVRLPKDFGSRQFKDIKQQWDAEGQIALEFLPKLKYWLDIRGHLNAADSLYHVFSHYVVIECDAEVSTYLKHSDLIQISKVTEQPYRRQNLYAVAG